jgi:hypothetical protein
MLRGLLIWISAEVCLLAVGYLFLPDWMNANANKVFVLSLALLMVLLLCYEHWPGIFTKFEGIRWVNQNTGLRIFRDNVDDSGQLAGMIDFWEGEKEGLFLQYMREGLNAGAVRATGIPQNGLKRRRVPAPVRNRSVEDTNADNSVIGSDDRVYESLLFDRWSVANFAKMIDRDAVTGRGPNGIVVS